jgi:hypothetical protein
MAGYENYPADALQRLRQQERLLATTHIQPKQKRTAEAHVARQEVTTCMSACNQKFGVGKGCNEITVVPERTY